MPPSPHALKQAIHCQLCAALLILPGMVWAQEPLRWAEHNRYAELAAGQHRQNYREQDLGGQTADGVLDSETGNQSAISAALRWQTANHWLLQLQANRQSGVTHYNGYLQSGNGSLTPYRARTGNTATQITVNAGYALNASNWPALPLAWQVTPMVQLGQQHWLRNLVQYGETYDHSHYALGALLQWQARPGTVVEAQAMVGRAQAASVSVPTLGFAADQPGGHLTEWQMGITQDVGTLLGRPQYNGWRLLARYASSQYSHGASPVVNALQAPPNANNPATWTLGLQKQF